MTPGQLALTPEAGIGLAAFAGSAMVSAVEAAMAHLPRGALTGATRRRLMAWIGRPQRTKDLLRTVDFSCDLLFFSCFVRLARGPALAGFDPVLLLFLVALPLLFMGAEVIPRVVGRRFPTLVVWAAWLPLEVIFVVLGPFAWAARRLAELLRRPLEARWGAAEVADQAELRAVLGSSARSGAWGQEGADMVEGVLDLEATRVRQVMTPRTDIVSLSRDAGWDEALDAFVDSPHRRLPLLEPGRDEVVGVLYAKDMLAALLADRRLPARELARKPRFLPEVIHLGDALDRFRESGRELAVVVDEYGGLEGLVTIEDVLEEIVGEIRDEHDEPEARRDAVAVRRRGRDYDLDGRLPLDDLGDLLGEDFEGLGVETLGGLVFLRRGVLPEVGDRVEYKGFVFQVSARERQRISRVLVRRGGERP